MIRRKLRYKNDDDIPEYEISDFCVIKYAGFMDLWFMGDIQDLKEFRYAKERLLKQKK